MNAAMTVKKLACGYGSQALCNNLNFQLEPGTLTCLLGPNGSGKSLVLRTLAGVLPALGGSVCLCGTGRGLVAYVPQQTPIAPLTVQEAVLMGRTPYVRFSFSKADRIAAGRAMERLGLDAWSKRLLCELSGGERQKVALARALAQESRVLLLDEPVANLDVRVQMEVYTLLNNLRSERGLAVLAAEHRLELAARYANSLLVLHGGKLKANGSPAAVLTPKLLSTVYGVKARLGQTQHGLELQVTGMADEAATP